MIQPNFKELAKQGDVKAIAALINRALQPQGITAKVKLEDNCLQVMLESTPVPDRQFCITLITKGMRRLGVASIESVRIFGRHKGEDFPAWTEELPLSPLDSQSDLVASPAQPSLTSPQAATPFEPEISPLSFTKTGISNEFNIDPLKAGFMFLIAIYGFRGLLDYEAFWFIHNFDYS